tara:strand:+ start:228 stop:461 length:234 start_codon:yes stop_codon:yes gene_type:complete
MDIYDLDMSAEDIGEILTIIRVQYLRLHVEPLAKKIGVKPSIVHMTEEGKGPHGIMILKKISNKFPKVQLGLQVKIS